MRSQALHHCGNGDGGGLGTVLTAMTKGLVSTRTHMRIYLTYLDRLENRPPRLILGTIHFLSTYLIILILPTTIAIASGEYPFKTQCGTGVRKINHDIKPLPNIRQTSRGRSPSSIYKPLLIGLSTQRHSQRIQGTDCSRASDLSNTTLITELCCITCLTILYIEDIASFCKGVQDPAAFDEWIPTDRCLRSWQSTQVEGPWFDNSRFVICLLVSSASASSIEGVRNQKPLPVEDVWVKLVELGWDTILSNTVPVPLTAFSDKSCMDPQETKLRSIVFDSCIAQPRHQGSTRPSVTLPSIAALIEAGTLPPTPAGMEGNSRDGQTLPVGCR